MKIAHLELFRAVMREGNFTGVARRRGIDPSAVSRAITTLESDLGIRLFERTTRRFAPTEAGRIYYAQTDSLIEELELAAARARDATAAPAGQLRVTASIAFGCEVLSPLVAGLRERYPALALELVLSDLPLDLVNERLDVAIRLRPASWCGGVSWLCVTACARVLPGLPRMHGSRSRQSCRTATVCAFPSPASAIAGASVMRKAPSRT